MIRNQDKLNLKNKPSFYSNSSIKINTMRLKRVTFSTTIIKLMIASTRRVREKIKTLVSIQNPNKRPSKPRASSNSMEK